MVLRSEVRALHEYIIYYIYIKNQSESGPQFHAFMIKNTICVCTNTVKKYLNYS